ncbi:PIR Superfamily Protein [Plasmodium ovale wallikeri]|uniref:PIR Superfamily Protein n=1 Tax=Plasmodium ovale wallikeri TaxID=864142 RepID=A0A1A9AJD2_PLAOA|nr:PIR Superfamily Protein [Plasmodium ovale wallikeri]SBT56290.1 PIR Superfamily Protein [Plasmodium ovale wallikeri]
MDGQDNTLSSLYSAHRYRQLDNKFFKYVDEEECKVFNNVPFTKPQIYDLCLKLTSNLKNYDQLPFSELSHISQCTYLNLWLSDNLLRIYSAERNEEFNSVIEKLISIWITHEEAKDKCELNFISYSFYDKFYDMKKLYDYAFNYKLMKLEFERDNNQCISEDREYIEKGIKLYKQVKGDCINKGTDKSYCDVLKDIAEEYSGEELSKQPCLQIKERSLSFSEASDDTEGVDTHAHGLKSTRGGDDQSRGTFESKDLENSPVGSNTSMIIAFPIIGILVTFIFYKFTPLGSWIRGHFLRNKISGQYLNGDETEELTDDTFIDYNQNFEMTGNNILYHPS